MTTPDCLPTFDYAQRLPGGFQLPARMSLLPLGDGNLALVSPVPIDEAMARTIAQHGRVHMLIAPNLLHHLYLRAPRDGDHRFQRIVITDSSAS